MTTAAPFAAIIVAAGRSRRMGSDKLWTDFWGRPTWRWSLDVLLASPGLQRVAITVPADAVDRFQAALPAGAEERCLVVPGGETRADSVIAGLWALTGAGFDDATIVLVHDAARPAVSVELVSRIAAAAAAGDWAVVPVVPVVDSLKRVRDERVVAPIARDEVAAAQTPQAARLGDLRAAIEEAHAWGRPVTDDAGALAAAGVSVHTIEGDPANRKLTEPGDVVPMRAVLAAGAAPLDVDRAAERPAVGDRLRRPPPGRGPPDAPRRPHLGRTSRAGRSATPTATPRCTRSSTRCSAPRSLATSARSFRPARRSGKGSTRRISWPGPSRGSPRPAGGRRART